MQTITVHNKIFKKYIEETQITKKIKQIATQIKSDYANKAPIFLVVLNGAFMFASKLFKEAEIENSEITFLRMQSYIGDKSGEITELLNLNYDIKDRNIIIAEDIVDTGQTIKKIIERLQIEKPKSIQIAALLYKEKAYNKTYPIKYHAFSIPNDFVIGYGLDYDNIGRQLKDIWQSE